MSGIIIKSKDWSKEEDKEKKQGKQDQIRKLVGQTGKPLGKIYPGRIKSILNGDTPVVSIGYGSGKAAVNRSEGEVWTDENAKTWKKENGVVTRIDNEEYITFLAEVRNQ